MTRKMKPIHPGEILFEEFLKPLGLSQNRLGRNLGIPPRRVNEIVHGKRKVTTDTALRLARYFKTTPEFWLNLQIRYDLDLIQGKSRDQIEREVGGCLLI